ncbi:MAG: aldo/keto reductase [Planctomycetes bacterium]|nr:aldo/keto reductase [Planctomycetota bacterium]
MKYACIAGLDKKVAKLVLGTMIIHTDQAEKSSALLDAAFELGYNTLDCAHVYGGGNSERMIGRWMEERGNRKDLVIATKGGHPNADRRRITCHDITSDLEDSLARLRTDHIDIYMLHRDDPTRPVAEIMDCLASHVKAGKIKLIGVSNWEYERLREANEYAAAKGLPQISISSPNFGLAEQVASPWGEGCVSLGGAAMKPARDWYEREHLPVFAYSSLARGLFSGRVRPEGVARAVADGLLDQACARAYCHEVNIARLQRLFEMAGKLGVSVPQLALAYTLNHAMEVYPLVGAACAEELRDNLKALEINLSSRDGEWLDLG